MDVSRRLKRNIADTIFYCAYFPNVGVNKLEISRITPANRFFLIVIYSSGNKF